jgi:SAM-dependent methyltransferase
VEGLRPGRDDRISGRLGGVEINPPTQYTTTRNLAARQRLWASGRREPAFDLIPWVIALADIGAGDRRALLDVGCGNGRYERAIVDAGHRGARIAADLSWGMASEVVDGSAVQADVESLPFATDAFDVVLAPHMLYHVPDIPAAARSMRRVLRTDGVMVAVTNSRENLRELRELVEAAAGGGWTMDRPADRRFSLENGAALLEAGFTSVRRVDCPASALVVTDADAVADYVASTADHYQDTLDRPWSEVVDGVRDRAAAAIARDGELRLGSAVGAFVCG